MVLSQVTLTVVEATKNAMSTARSTSSALPRVSWTSGLSGLIPSTRYVQDCFALHQIQSRLADEMSSVI